MSKNGSPQNVEYKFLRGREFAMLGKPGSKTRRSALAETYRAHLAYAERALKNYSGHLNAVERKECRKVVAGIDTFTYTNPEKSEARIKAIIEAGVPGIFLEDLEGSKGFPAVDYVIHSVCNDTQFSFGPDKRKIWFQPTGLEHIKQFRTYAFDGETISPHVIRDVNGRAERNLAKKVSQSIISRQINVFAHLETALSGVAPGQREYNSFTEGSPLDFLKEFLWHIRFTLEDRMRIAEDFVKRFLNGEESLRSDSILRNRASVIFPVEVEKKISHIPIEKKRDSATLLSNALISYDFTKISFEDVPQDEHESFMGVLKNYVGGVFAKIISDRQNLGTFLTLEVSGIMRTYMKLSDSLKSDSRVIDLIVEKLKLLVGGFADEEVTSNAKMLMRVLATEEKNPLTRLHSEYLELLRVRLEKPGEK